MPVCELGGDSPLPAVDYVEEHELVEPFGELEYGDHDGVLLEVRVPLDGALEALDPVLAVDEPEPLIADVELSQAAPAEVLVLLEAQLPPDVEEGKQPISFMRYLTMEPLLSLKRRSSGTRW